jgi:hypothetical protein
MTGCGPFRFNLKNAEQRQAAFLTLALFMCLFSKLSCADTPLNTIANQETKQHISEVESYIRQQSLQGMSLLPNQARTAIGWVSGKWHSVALEGDTTNSSADTSAPALLGSIEQQTVDGMPVSFGSNFHHKGFLPTHDAFLMGMGIGQNALGNKLQFTLRPFYGQGWDALEGYWGSELAMTIAQRPDGMPWGKISITYTDHGRGIDLSGNIDLTNHLTFTSGIKQNDITGDSNYVMLKWKVSFGNNSR